MSHPVHKISSLARPVEPKYPTNLAVIMLLPVIAVGLFAYAAFGGAGMADAARIAFTGLFSAFLTWALGREMDPDHNATAFIAMALAVFATAVGYGFDFFALAAMLFAVRIVNRTVGPQARTGDVVILVLLNVGAVFVDGAWWMPFVSAIALGIDEFFERGSLPQRAAIPALLVLGILPFFVADAGFDVMQTLVRGWIVTIVVITLLTAGNIYNTQEIESVMDALGTPCNCRRIQAGMAVILLGGVAAIMGGQPAIAASLGIWSVLAAALVGRNISLDRKDEDESADD
jgi:hypothetical protein